MIARLLLAIAAVLALSGCAESILDPRGVLMIDPSFTAEQLEAVVEAADAWTEWTEGRVRLDVRVGRTQQKHAWIVPMRDESRELLQGTGLIGLCFRSMGPVPGMLLDTSLPIDRFRTTAAHEIGHAMGLEHVNDHDGTVGIMSGMLLGHVDQYWLHNDSRREFNDIWGVR